MKKLLLVILVLILLIVPSSAWLTDYSYRKEHYITGNASWGGSQTNYNVPIVIYRSTGSDSGNTVYVGTDCQSDYDDIRFTDEGDTELDYWIQEGYTSSSATFWLECSSLAEGNNTFYMYYGDADGVDNSDGYETFPLFDDFNGASLNSTQWIDSGSIYIGSGFCSVTGQSGVPAYLASDDDFGLNQTIFTRSSFYGDSTRKREIMFYEGIQTYLKLRYYPFDSSTGLLAYDSGEIDSDSIDMDTDYHLYEIKNYFVGNNDLFYIDIDGTNEASVELTPVSGVYGNVQLYSEGTDSNMIITDYIFVYNDNYYIPIHGPWTAAESIGTAEFSANTTYGDVDQCVQFYDNSTGSPTAWYWDFGDGNTSTNQNPYNTYGYEGVFNVSLNASYYGVNVTETKVGYINIGQPPVASFTMNVSEGAAPLSVLFTDTSSNGPTAWNWSFGDGEYSDLQNPSHEFDSRGSYTVILNASSGYGYDTEEGEVNVTYSGNTTGAGIHYPPHQVELVFKDKVGNYITDADVSIVPTETSMGSWEWLYTLFGIDYEDVPLDTMTLSGTTDDEGSITFLMVESARYNITIVKDSEGVSESMYLYPKNEHYLFFVSTTSAEIGVPEFGDVITYTLGEDYYNNTYVYLNFTWTDTGETYVDFINWYVSYDEGYIVNNTLGMDDGNTSASYALSLGYTDDSYTYGFKAYHPTYGWINQSRTLTDHKEIDIGLEGTWLNFAAFGLVAMVGLMFSRKSWKVGMFVTCIFALALTQMHILIINESYESTMFILGGLTFLSVIILLRGSGDKNV